MKSKESIGNLTPAPWNPRKITDKQLSMLKKSMAEFGDLSGIVVNVQTGHIVGGHQRVKNLDPSWRIIKQPHTDKVGTVALGHIETPWGRWQYREVDWPEKKEATANVAANKQGGEFDLPKLKEILITLDTGDLDMELTGFNSHEIELMMTAIYQGNGDADNLPSIDLGDAPDSIKKNIEGLEEIREERKKERDEVNTKNDTEKYIVIIFSDREEKINLLKQLNLPPDERYISATILKIERQGTVNYTAPKSASMKKSGATG